MPSVAVQTMTVMQQQKRSRVYAKYQFSSFPRILKHCQYGLSLLIERVEWSPTKYSVLCEKHFNEKFIARGKLNLRRPIPTIHAPEALKTPSSLVLPSEPRIAPKPRVFQKDELSNFLAADIIKDFSSLYVWCQIKKNNDSNRMLQNCFRYRH